MKAMKRALSHCSVDLLIEGASVEKTINILKTYVDYCQAGGLEDGTLPVHEYRKMQRSLILLYQNKDTYVSPWGQAERSHRETLEPSV